MSAAPARASPRLARLLGFLNADPDNLQLIADAAVAAREEGEPETATQLIGRYAALSAPTPALENLKGLIALDERRYADAVEVFGALVAQDIDDPALRFNLAWAKAMTMDYEGALALLDDAVVEASPRAPALKIQMLHHLARLDEALGAGRALASTRPTDTALMGALAIVALDAEEVELARTYASKAGGAHDGLSTLGMLELNDDRVDAALGLFDRALDTYPGDARAQLGKGLALMARGDIASASAYIDRGADLFGHHLGSWVASGWAHFVQRDYAASRASFDRAMALDDTFAETHGGLAVLDMLEGHKDSAKRRTEVALRLDPKCFSGALAQSMILAAAGDQDRADRIVQIALRTPIGDDGRTIAQAMAGLGMTAGKAPDNS